MNLAISNELVLAIIRALGVVMVLPMGTVLSTLGLRLVMIAGLGFFGSTLGGAAGEITALSVIGECVVGCCLAMPIFIVLEAVSYGAELIETGRGQTIARLYNPFALTFEVPLAVLSRYLMWGLMVASGVLCHLVRVYFDSFSRIPFAVHSRHYRWSSSAVAQASIRYFGYAAEVLQAALSVALTFAILYFVIDLCMGFISKVVPSANLMSEAFLLKSVASAVALMILWNWGFGTSIVIAAQAVWLGN